MCERCGKPECKGYDGIISEQNTQKFVDELRYLCRFAVEGNVHPVLTQISRIFLAVIDDNVNTGNEEPLKKFHDFCFHFALELHKQEKKEDGESNDA